MTIRPLTAEDAGKRVRIVQPFPPPCRGMRVHEGFLVWDESDTTAPIGLQTIDGSAEIADLWFKAGTEGEVLE